jgi:nitrous oxidase accessory protein NosD
MKHYKPNYLISISAAIAFLIVTMVVAARPASAQVQLLPYVYVSANGGSDSNSCSRTAPCRQIAKALENMSSGGTVTILASGDYQSFNINKSVDIVAEPGINAVISTSGTGSTAVYVGLNISSVRLRGLTIRAGGTGAMAINVQSAVTSFEIDNCEIRGGEHGLLVNNDGDYSIRNTRFSGAVSNLEFSTLSGTINATVDSCSFNRGLALMVGRYARVTIKNSTSNGGGYWATGTGARMFVDNCVINASNDDGIFVDAGAFVRLSDSTIANGLEYGIRVNTGGSLRSFGNNRLFNNASGDISGTVGVLSGQ